MRAKEFITEAAAKRGTCPKCSDGHKNENYFDKEIDDENSASKANWVCRNCGMKVPAKNYNTKKLQRMNALAKKLMGEGQLDELAFDDQNGIGITPNNREIDHIGMRVLMKPQDFLRLAQTLRMSPDEEEKVKAMATSGKAFGPPWLKISVPNEWRDRNLPPEQRFAQPGRVIEHEGRHRMMAHELTEGNVPVEVHIVLQSPGKEWRTRNWVYDNKNDYSQAVVDALNISLKSETGITLRGPFFHYEASEE